MSLTLPQIRAKLYQLKDFGWRNLGFQSTAESRTADGWVDPVWFGASNYGEFQFADGWIRGLGMSSNERVKIAGELTGSYGLAHADANDYTAPFTVNLTYEWTVPWVHPDALDDAIRNCLQEIYVQWDEAVSPWFNGNFNDSDTGWVAGSTAPASITPVSASSYNQSGQYSLRVANNSVNDFATSQYPLSRNVTPGQVWRLGAVAQAISGTGRFRVYDVTHGTQIGTSMDTVGYARCRMMQDFTIPSGCYEINCRLEGVESTADIVWDFLPGFRKGALDIEVPSWMDAPFKLITLAEKTYREPVQGATNVWLADSGKPYGWSVKGDYHLEHELAASTPNRIHIDREGGLSKAEELWYQGRRTYDEIEDQALTDDYASTDAPELLIMAAATVAVCDLLYANDNDAKWQLVRSRAQATLDAQIQARKEERPKQRPQRIGGRLGP